MRIVHNETLAQLLENEYSSHRLDAIYRLLSERGTFDFKRLDNGLFPAANLRTGTEYSGYSHVWVRDNVYVAFAHHLQRQNLVAVRNVRTLVEYFWKYRRRFEGIIEGAIDFNQPMNRPHIRFDGETLSEIDEKWSHAQNDALGYFLWLFCLLHDSASEPLTPKQRQLLALFVHYFKMIRYWQDFDSGHWEETRKIGASSIGVVVAGLRGCRDLMQQADSGEFGNRRQRVTPDLLDELIGEGEQALARILPAESIPSDSRAGRRYDSALLFLLFPLNVVTEEMGARILQDVRFNLEGDYGIRRYQGDSFWAADYKKHLGPRQRTVDYSDNLAARDALLQPGEEAQWCIFDPIISILFARRYHKYCESEDLALQTHYFNRSLGQLTADTSRFGGLKCPELYYLEDGRYVPNDAVPLLWTQANLWMSFQYMYKSTEFRPQGNANRN